MPSRSYAHGAWQLGAAVHCSLSSGRLVVDTAMCSQQPAKVHRPVLPSGSRQVPELARFNMDSEEAAVVAVLCAPHAPPQDEASHIK